MSNRTRYQHCVGMMAIYPIFWDLQYAMRHRSIRKSFLVHKNHANSLYHVWYVLRKHMRERKQVLFPVGSRIEGSHLAPWVRFVEESDFSCDMLPLELTSCWLIALFQLIFLPLKKFISVHKVSRIRPASSKTTYTKRRWGWIITLSRRARTKQLKNC